MKTRTDALARRLRWEAPSPRKNDARIVITEDDLDLFSIIDRHGFLPTPYLHLFQKQARRNLIHLQKRLGRLYHAGYLARPRAQFRNIDVRQQPVVHDLGPRARAALTSCGRLGRFPLRRSNDFVHDLMKACITASIELLASERGSRFISREDILTHPNCGRSAGSENPLALPISLVSNEVIVPDDIFALEYPLPDGRKGTRWFALEADRNTESVRGPAKNTFGKKISHYLSALRSRSFSHWWGVHNLHVLTVTTSAHRAAALADEVRTLAERPLADRFSFSFDHNFSSRVSIFEDGQWKVPRETLRRLLEEPWLTANGIRHLSNPRHMTVTR